MSGFVNIDTSLKHEYRPTTNCEVITGQPLVCIGSQVYVCLCVCGVLACVSVSTLHVCVCACMPLCACICM